LGAVEPNDTGFCGLSLRNIVPVGTHTVKGYIEIDDMNNFALDRTPDFSIDVDFGTGLQEVTLCESTTTSDEENEQGLSESEEVEFHEDIEFHAYNENKIDVQFCNFVLENEETVSFNFWVHNCSNKAITVYAQDIYVDGEYVSLYEKIGFYQPNEYGYGRFTLSEITPDTYYTIKAFIEIDNETSDQCIDKGTPFVIDVDFSSGELSAREE
jgi:hypothetical protein